MTFIRAEQVTAPIRRWKLDSVVLDRGEGKGVYALGTWDGRPVLCYRWNGTAEFPKGNPISSGHPTWLVLPNEDYNHMIEAFPNEEKTYCKSFLGL